MVNSALQVHSVSKRFRQGENEVHALKDLSLQVEAGEFVAIMGPSGCGKSTLLHVLAGLTDVDHGTVEAAGENLSKMSDRQLTRFRRSHVGLVFQAFNLITSLTAFDNIRLPLSGGNRKESQTKILERVTHLLRRLGLEGRQSHKPNSMSGGEQQRVAIARALVNDPNIVFADEPTGSLDSATGQEVCQLLSELCREEGKSIVLVTHEPSVARWASRVLVMRDGTIIRSFPVPPEADANWLAMEYQQSLANEKMPI